ncbi:MAG: 3'-5' exonuclease domain-containing protein 2 [Bacteroidales bacterium]|nr:3'-5' exonuclease domain-containing protein 2 [Candidatus Minthousia equi]
MKKLKVKTSKDYINTLPVVNFEGRIITILSEGEVEKAVNYLLSFPILGLDTETRPSFKKGKQNKVALLQVSNEDTCFLFRLNNYGLTPPLIRLLESPVIKVGLSLHDDFAWLHKRGDFVPTNYVELQELVREFGIQDLSLQKIYANLFDMRISKAQRLTNWEAEILTDKQKKYAAFDAVACVQIYNELMRLKETKDYILEEIHEENISETGEG